VQADEAEWVTKVTELTASDLTTHDSGDAVMVGEIPIQLLHTPGHTPGSQCFHVANRLVAGDTLFLEGCGRTDLPGSDPALMYESLQTLSAMPHQTIVCPGHQYSAAPTASLETVLETNPVFTPTDRRQWLEWFAR
ncbi:MAG: MBL fold metallo-hydrolase, partial [Actinomycetota bacterium]